MMPSTIAFSLLNASNCPSFQGAIWHEYLVAASLTCSSGLALVPDPRADRNCRCSLAFKDSGRSSGDSKSDLPLIEGRGNVVARLRDGDELRDEL